ncbi:MAG: trimethylamine methyltransferase family protein, partial [Pseudomonadota bacterium]
MRSSAPGQNPHLEVPFITRNIPTYDLVGDESLEKIENNAERILAEIGIEFREDEETVALFRAAGGEIEELTADRWNIKFPPGMIREILKTAPASFTQHARNPAKSVQIGGDAVVFAPAYGSPFVMDLDKGRRYGTIEDFRNFIR